MNRLIVISAPSGAGKTTLCKKLLEDYEKLTLSISSTTRQPRGQEKHGRDYFFMPQDEFKDKIQKHYFAEWALVHGNYYGTSKAVIDQAFKQSKWVLLDIDVQGAASLKKTYPNEAFLIFIAPPDLVALEARLRARGTDREEVIQTRIQNARREMNEASHFDQVIVNDHLDRAYGELKKVIEELMRG